MRLDFVAGKRDLAAASVIATIADEAKAEGIGSLFSFGSTVSENYEDSLGKFPSVFSARASAKLAENPDYPPSSWTGYAVASADNTGFGIRKK